jgi:hypothetical protein
MSEDAARRAVDRWLNHLEESAAGAVYSFYAAERAAGSSCCHLHVLTGGTAALTTAQLKAAWKVGFAQVEVFDPEQGGAWYVSKGFLRSEVPWWDVRLTGAQYRSTVGHLSDAAISP